MKLNCTTEGYFCINIKAAKGASSPVIWQFKTFLDNSIITIRSSIGFPLNLIALLPPPDNMSYIIITSLELSYCDNIISKVNYEVITKQKFSPHYLCGLISVKDSFLSSFI